MNIKNLLDSLSLKYKSGLEYFDHNFLGPDVGFKRKHNDINIVSAQQGIYKPKESQYVFSIKETLGGGYPDLKPVYLYGGWIYLYHQQGEVRDKEAANRAMMKNIEDKIVVGVLIQTRSKGKNGCKYKAAIGLPIGWFENYFIIVGSDSKGEIPDELLQMSLRELYIYVISENQKTVVEMNDEEKFNPTSVEDERVKVIGSIVRRVGQGKFREDLLKLYKSRCPITGCDVPEALEAAHITPYLGQATNSLQNGLILRADIHTLWDLGLICINTSDMTVILNNKLLNTHYGKLHGIKLQIPEDLSKQPSITALNAHRDFCNL